jgi:ElaB/YqjD/DUF883 family membrane-anchored ribosome-binding protein
MSSSIDFITAKGKHMDTPEKNLEQSNEARDKLMTDLKVVIKDAEELLKNTGQQTGEGFRAARVKFENTLDKAKSELHHLEDTLIAKTKSAADATDRYVKDNPWQSVGLAASVGLVCGLLIARR